MAVEVVSECVRGLAFDMVTSGGGCELRVVKATGDALAFTMANLAVVVDCCCVAADAALTGVTCADMLLFEILTVVVLLFVELLLLLCVKLDELEAVGKVTDDNGGGWVAEMNCCCCANAN